MLSRQRYRRHVTLVYDGREIVTTWEAELDSIGTALRTSRERAGLSQEAAADVLGINRVLLAYYETGRRQVPLSVGAALAMPSEKT